VPDDRFADLGPERKSAADRFAELDERSPEPGPKRPPGPVRQGRYGWVVGVAFIIVVIVAGANSLRNSGHGYRGVPPGKPLPAFAAPLAVGGPDGKDVNIAPSKACKVHGAGVFNVCDVKARQPIAMTFVANASRGCETQLDRIESVRREFPSIAFVGVVSKRERPDVERIVRSHGWNFPVVVDHDLALFNLYGVGDCPTTVFARRGGVANRSVRGKIDLVRLRRELTQIR
jgi:peroxiredoxin